MSKKTNKRKNNNTILFIIIVILIIGGIILIYNNKINDSKNDTKKIDNEIDDLQQKKNYEFNGKTFVGDDFFSIDNEAIYINDNDIYYVIYKNNSFDQNKIVSKGKGVGIVDGKLVGYIDQDSIIDENFAKQVEGTNYVIYSVKETIPNDKTDKEENPDNNNDNTNTDSADVFNLDDINSENFYRGSGYSGASNKAVYLKNNVAYYLVFNGDDLVSKEVIAKNVKKIGNIGDNKSRIIVVYIENDTILDDKYKDYEIMTDDNGNK